MNEEESNNKNILNELKENEVLNSEFNEREKSKPKKETNKKNKSEFNSQKN